MVTKYLKQYTQQACEEKVSKHDVILKYIYLHVVIYTYIYSYILTYVYIYFIIYLYVIENTYVENVTNREMQEHHLEKIPLQ